MKDPLIGFFIWTLLVLFIIYLRTSIRPNLLNAPDEKQALVKPNDEVKYSTIEVIDSGHIDEIGDYEIVTWNGRAKVQKRNRFLGPFDKQKDAYETAKRWGREREPLHHRAHRFDEFDHYHITNHNYLRKVGFKSVLNYHFNYGPKITKDWVRGLMDRMDRVLKDLMTWYIRRIEEGYFDWSGVKKMSSEMESGNIKPTDQFTNFPPRTFQLKSS